MNEYLDRLTAALADHYAIESELGAGGMATVYLAQDIKHDRQVAVKVLRPELAAVLGPERFLKEIRVTANLQHPHILPLFDSGEADGFLFYVMPFVAGESLADKLKRERQLSIEESLEITGQVASALGYAHSHGVVHRDIKPDNIMLTSGHAIVADFGIARAVDVAGGEQLTGTGTAIGTPAYMSPEQSAGESDVDGRTDIYALGSVLYELLAGEPPFTGPSAAAIIAKRLSTPVPQVHVLRETVPEHIAEAVTRSMQKAPADRFATASQFASALKSDASEARSSTAETQPVRITPLSGRVAKRRTVLGAVAAVAVLGVGWWATSGDGIGGDLDPNVIAVMPFRVGGDPAFEYLRESMLDLLGARLTGETGPRVLESRTTLSAWRRRVDDDGDDLSEDDSRRVAAELGAGQLILGNIVATPTELTMSGSLLNVSNGDLLASGTVAGPPDSVAVLVNRLTAQLLSLEAGEGRERLEGLATTSLPALQEYLAGQQAYREGDYIEAISLYGRAFEIDSEFVQAGFGMVATNYWIGDGVTQAGLFAGPAVWRQREKLSAADLAFLLAVPNIGPDFPLPSSYGEIINRADSAARGWPDRPEPWTLLGQLLFYYGGYAAVPDWADRAARALDRAIALDSTFAVAWDARLLVATYVDDPAVTREIVDASERFRAEEFDGNLPLWGAGVASGDSARTVQWRNRFVEFSHQNLYQLPMHSIGFGLPLSDAHLALETIRNRAATQREMGSRSLGETALAFVEGRIQDAMVAIDDFDPGFPPVFRDGHRLMMALFEPTARATAMETVGRIAAAYPTIGFVPGGHVAYQWPGLLDCHVSLLRTVQGDTSNTREAIRRQRDWVKEAPVPDPGLEQLWVNGVLETARVFPVCPLLLEVLLDGPAQLDALDSLMQVGPPGVENFIIPGAFANLVIARMREAQGDIDGALAAVRRRTTSYNPGFLWPLVSFLRQEGRLAAMVGDSTGAIRAYEHYLTLRTDPDPPLVAQRDSVVAELAELAGR